MRKKKVKITVGVITLVCLSGILCLLYQRFPLTTLSYKLTENHLSAFFPSDRVTEYKTSKGTIQKQIADLAYFSTDSNGFKRATIKLQYINQNPNQEIHLGFRNRQQWHYESRPINLPLINNLDWRQVTDTAPFLYAKNDTSIQSLDELIKNNQDKILGTYYLSARTLAKHSIDSLFDYTPSTEVTSIDTPLVGKHTLYAFLQDEPFSLSVVKQDLNIVEGEDIMRIRVYHDGELVTERVAPDDGILDASGKGVTEEEVEIKYEGGFPHSGVYKIEIDANNDTTISSIKTNLHKIVFEGKVLPLEGEVPLYTKQEVIDGLGYFALSENHYFEPFVYKRYEVQNESDLEKLDYLLTDYQRPSNNDSWREVTLQFDLRNAYYIDNALWWLIYAPGLKEMKQGFYIVDREVTLEKDSILKR
jgi:hypothetical protein